MKPESVFVQPGLHIIDPDTTDADAIMQARNLKQLRHVPLASRGRIQEHATCMCLSPLSPSS